MLRLERPIADPAPLLFGVAAPIRKAMQQSLVERKRDGRG
jgi:hypothetical protein